MKVLIWQRHDRLDLVRYRPDMFYWVDSSENSRKGNEHGAQAVISPREHTDIVHRKYWNITGNTDKTRYQKDQLLKCNFFLTPIIIIYGLMYEYLNTTTVLLILYVLNAQNGCHSHKKFEYVIACPQEDKKKMTPCACKWL